MFYQSKNYNGLGFLPTTETLVGTGFFTGVEALVVLRTAAFVVGAAAVLWAAGAAAAAAADVTLGAAGFPAVTVVVTGAEFTNTGSVEGMGLPSLVCNFTTCVTSKFFTCCGHYRHLETAQTKKVKQFETRPQRPLP